MNISEGVREAFDVIRGNKARSILTMTGINFGVGCLIAISVVGLAFRDSITNELGRYGSTLLWVQVNGRAYASREPRIFLREKDLQWFRSALPGFEAGESIFQRTYPASYRGETHRTTIMGVKPVHFDFFSIHVEKGRPFLEQDSANRSSVCILRPDIAAKLFRGEDPLGRVIRIGDKNFTVIGLTERFTQGFLSDGSDNNTIFVPQEFVASRVWGGREIKYWIYIMRLDTQENVDHAAERVEDYLEKKYGELRGEKRFNIERLDSYVDMVDKILTIVSTLVLVIASISIVVGGLGIMNIMLVAVTERTREIGVRMAVGAKRADILSQFIIEAVILCLLGGGAGILFGSGLAAIACKILEWRFLISFGIVMMALGISTAIGLTFGIYPAYKASKLLPIEALRAEF